MIQFKYIVILFSGILYNSRIKVELYHIFFKNLILFSCLFDIIHV